MSSRTKQLLHENVGVLYSPAKQRQQTLSGIKDSYNLAIEHYQKGNFEAAEQELVKALKPTLSKHVMQALYVETEDVKAELVIFQRRVQQIIKEEFSKGKKLKIFGLCANDCVNSHKL